MATGLAIGLTVLGGMLFMLAAMLNGGEGSWHAPAGVLAVSIMCGVGAFFAGQAFYRQEDRANRASFERAVATVGRLCGSRAVEVFRVTTPVSTSGDRRQDIARVVNGSSCRPTTAR